MATASLYGNNDYTPLQYRPYELPVNDIMRAFVAKNQFWEQGAARVKSVYENALNLDLTLDQNKKYKEEFMTKAQEEMKKLSSMDLSDADVQKKGMSIFSPLLKDKMVAIDDQLTKRKRSIFQEAEVYKTKKLSKNGVEGEGYNQENLAYALDGFEEFNSMTNRDEKTLTDLYNKLGNKSYTPYYDNSSEINMIMKNCKPDENTFDTPSGMYNITHSDKSLTSLKVSNCLGNLSEKAQRQLSITGYMKYKNNPLALRDGYLPQLEGSIDALNEESAKYNAILTNKDKLKNLSNAQLSALGLSKSDLSKYTNDYFKSLDDKVKDNQLRLSNLNKTTEQLRNGDLSPITGSNLETVAHSVYSRDYIKRYAQAYAYQDITDKQQADAAKMLIYKTENDNAQQEDSQEFQLMLKKMELENKIFIEGMKAPKDIVDSYLTNDKINDARMMNTADENDVSNSNNYNDITKAREEIASKRATLNNTFLSKLRHKSIGMTEQIVPSKDYHTNSSTFQTWYNNYKATLPKDDPNWGVIHDYENQMQNLVISEDLNKNSQLSIDKQLMKTSPQLYKLGVPNIPVAGLYPQEILNAMQGKQSRLKIDDQSRSSTGDLEYIADKRYYIDGKRLTDEQIKNSGLEKAIRNLEGAEFERITNLDKERNKLAKTMTINQKEGYYFPELNNEKSTFKQRLLQISGLSDKGAGELVNVGQTDLRGNVHITLTEDEKKYNLEETIERLKKTYGVNGITEVSPKEFILHGVQELNQLNNPNSELRDKMLPFINNLEQRVTNTNTQTTGLMRSKNIASYGLEISKGLGGGYDYRVYNNANTTISTHKERGKALYELNNLLNR